jgi:hypothetical protein
MKLQVGERLSGSGSANSIVAYVVTDVVRETDWSCLYTAKRVFANFDFTRLRLREADAKEWLDVLLRTRGQAPLAEVRTEVERVLVHRRHSLWPEPLDVLVTAPPTGRRSEPRPILVMARPHGISLLDWLLDQPPFEAQLTVVAELLEFVHDAHADGLLLNSVDPAALLVDRAGRLHYLGSDRVRVDNQGANSGSMLMPPDPLGYAAPECFERARSRDRRADLYSWAAIAYRVLAQDDPGALAKRHGHPWAKFGDNEFSLLEKRLRSLPPVLVQDWATQLSVDDTRLLESWPENFVEAIQCCLSIDPGNRPADVAALRGLLGRPASEYACREVRVAEDAELLAELWDRVFDEGDAKAHQLILLLLKRPERSAAYVNALAAELSRRADALGRDRKLARLGQCLLQAGTARPLLDELRRHPDARVREFGRELARGAME